MGSTIAAANNVVKPGFRVRPRYFSIVFSLNIASMRAMPTWRATMKFVIEPAHTASQL